MLSGPQLGIEFFYLASLFYKAVRNGLVTYTLLAKACSFIVREIQSTVRFTEEHDICFIIASSTSTTTPQQLMLLRININVGHQNKLLTSVYCWLLITNETFKLLFRKASAIIYSETSNIQNFMRTHTNFEAHKTRTFYCQNTIVYHFFPLNSHVPQL